MSGTASRVCQSIRIHKRDIDDIVMAVRKSLSGSRQGLICRFPSEIGLRSGPAGSGYHLSGQSVPFGCGSTIMAGSDYRTCRWLTCSAYMPSPTDCLRSRGLAGRSPGPTEDADRIRCLLFGLHITDRQVWGYRAWLWCDSRSARRKRAPSPSIARALARWFHSTDRGRVTGIMWMSARFGGAICPASGYTAHRMVRLGDSHLLCSAWWARSGPPGFWRLYRDDRPQHPAATARTSPISARIPARRLLMPMSAPHGSASS